MSTLPTFHNEKTLPHRPKASKSLANKWLAALMITSAFSLVGTVGWYVWVGAQPPAPPQAVALVASPTPLPLREVKLTLNDVTRTLVTSYLLPYDILREQGITLGAHDAVWLDELPVPSADVVLWSQPISHIRIAQAITITLSDDAETQTHHTHARTVGEALAEANKVLYVADSVQPPLNTPLEDGMQIVITRASSLEIVVDGVTIQARARGATVADALSEVGVTLVGLDYSIPAETTPLTEGMRITIMRISEETLYEDEPIPYDVTYEPRADLPLDTRETLRSGQAGILRHYTRVRYANGVEVGREPAGSEVIQAAQNAVIAYGTNVVIYTLNTPEGTLEYWRKLRVYATSYHPAAVGGNTRTAIGETLRKGIVGADPTIIPFRTRVYVPNYGIGMIADTGGARSSRYWIDLGYSDEDWVSWSRYVDVYLLTPVPANINYLLPEWQPMRGRPDSGK